MPAAAAWFVGDHPTADVEGAVAAGLTAVWRRNRCWEPPRGPHHRVDGIGEVLSLIDRDRAPAA